MPAPFSPTVRHRRLAKELRELRQAAGMTAEQVAKALNDLGGTWSKSKISRIESAQWRRPTPRDVRDMLDVYGVTDETLREALSAIARAAQERGWWTAYKDVLMGSYIGFEADAATIRIAEPVYVPGLLQTEEYARAVFEAGSVAPEADEAIERRVAARLARREHLFNRPDPPDLWAVVDEGALRRPVGGAAAMRRQLDSLIEAAADPNINLQILPTALGAHPAMGGTFIVLEFPDPRDTPIVYLGTATDGLYLERADQVALYGKFFDRLRANALGFDDSLRLIATIRDQLE